MDSGFDIIVFITASSPSEARKIADSLLKSKLVACCNIIHGIKSIFWWKGDIEESEEVLLICKSTLSIFRQLVKEVKKIHSYSVPEILAVPIIIGNRDYLKWLKEVIGEDFKD